MLFSLYWREPCCLPGDQCVTIFWNLYACRIAAQLARTEEAAKRALVQTDASAKGGAAQKLLDAERALQKLRAENAELSSKLSR
jgi:hypothetical protein